MATRDKRRAVDIESEIRVLVLGLKEGWNATGLARSFLSLLSAESLGLISNDWRTRVDAVRIAEIMSRDHDELVSRWDHYHQYFHRLITDSAGLNDDEIVLVMGQRSYLESVGSHLGPSFVERAEALDAVFTDCLKDCAEVVRQVRARKTLGVEARLPRHWWWRQDTP